MIENIDIDGLLREHFDKKDTCDLLADLIEEIRPTTPKEATLLDKLTKLVGEAYLWGMEDAAGLIYSLLAKKKAAGNVEEEANGRPNAQ